MDAAEEAARGACHHALRLNLLKMVMSNICEARKAELEATAMRGVATIAERMAPVQKPIQAIRPANLGPDHRLLSSVIRYPTG